jgi:hypothetical protein
MKLSLPPRSSGREPPHAPQIYGCLGRSMRCGRCARAVRRIMSKALMSCAPATDATFRNATTANKIGHRGRDRSSPFLRCSLRDATRGRSPAGRPPQLQCPRNPSGRSRGVQVRSGAETCSRPNPALLGFLPQRRRTPRAGNEAAIEPAVVAQLRAPSDLSAWAAWARRWGPTWPPPAAR